MYKIVDTFTTRDGRWEVDDREYGLDRDMLEKYGSEKHQLGGATHIYAKVVGGPANRVRFFTRDGEHSFPLPVNREGWANMNLSPDAAYKPDLGEAGWWSVEVADAPSEIRAGIGLPNKWHVSRFVVFVWDGAGEQPEGPTPVEPPAEGEGIWAEVRVGEDIYAGFLTKAAG